ncbi:MAG: c-type cytochrome [Nitrospinota bacterium]|nr:c-type cytochrome [Nitrospinota bacterium]
MFFRAVIVFCLAWNITSPGPAMGQDIAAGEDLFNRKCKMCHRLSDGTKQGPGLEGVTARRDESWLHAWLEDPKGMIEKGDPVAVELQKKYKKVMTKIAAMQDEENRKNIIAFLRQNDIKRGAVKE